MKNPNILVIEDQVHPLDSISYAIKKAILKEEGTLPRIGKYTWEEVEQELKERNIDVARSFREANMRILNSTNNFRPYNLFFLDHVIPRIEIGLEGNNIMGIGYTLIPTIRNYQPNATIIGTSSMSENQLREFDKPDFYLDKSSIRTIDTDLSQILLRVEGGQIK